MPGAPARSASTVVLIRPSRTGFEVLLVKRHDNVAFMGGAHVFPGGRVDASDRIARPERICDGVTEAAKRLPHLDLSEAVAHYVAAVRELFEEAGILLARSIEVGRVRELRHALVKDGARNGAAAGMTGLTLEQLASREGFKLALDNLVLFANWVTPEIEIKRFDAFFFVATLPEGQTSAHDEYETTESEWMTPQVAVERCRGDEIMLPPPTWTTLRMLSKLSSVDEVTTWARERPLVQIQPKFFESEVEPMLTLPGDPTFPPIEGFETPEETRFILVNGRWRAAP